MGVIKAAISGTPRMSGGDTHNFIGAPSFRSQNPGYSFLNCYASDSYASIYPSVKSIAHEFKKIRPFAIDQNGKPQENVPALNALYHPNQVDSSVAFFEKLAVMNLTHRKTYVLVWRREGNEAKPGGEITPTNIAGFTFLEYPSITRRDNQTFYNMGSQQFTESEVMVIPGGVDPTNLYAGYAPGEASRRWATLDQYIADYQSGFFENGAVPAGQFVITAASKRDYNDTVDKLQSAHRGAGKNNNVTYTPRPVDPETGKPADAKIEWIPFASTNKEIDFKNLFEQANNRIDSTFGVPASIRGVGENNNYATARLDEKNFLERAVDPLALSIYTQITHELNRITGGLGVAITYKLEIPTIADEEKVQAETKAIEATAINTLVDKGYTLDSVIEALDLSTRYKKLKKGDDSTTDIDNDKPDVDEGNEVDDSPDPDKIDGVTPLNSGDAKRTNPKAQLADTDTDIYEQELAITVREHMQKQIDDSIESLDTVFNEMTEEDVEEFNDAMMVTIVAVLLAAGELQYQEGRSLLVDADVSTDGLSAFELTSKQEDSYRKYLKRVAQSYTDDTAASIRAVLDRSNIEGWDRNDTEAALRNIMSTDEWRVTRLATTEINRSQSVGGIESMKQIQNEAEVVIEKSLQHTGGDRPCEFCQVLLDRWVQVDSEFIGLDEVVTGAEGGKYLNDFAANEGYDVHPNGHCIPEFRVVK